MHLQHEMQIVLSDNNGLVLSIAPVEHSSMQVPLSLHFFLSASGGMETALLFCMVYLLPFIFSRGNVLPNFIEYKNFVALNFMISTIKFNLVIGNIYRTKSSSKTQG